MSQDIKSDLRAAAAAVYRGSQPKLLLSQVLIERMAQGQNGQLMAAEVDCSTACSMLGMPQNDLLQLLRGDPCLRASQAAFGDGRQPSISLDYHALQRAVRGSGQGHGMSGVAAPPAAAPYMPYNGMNGMQQQQQYAQPMYRFPGPPPQYPQHMQQYPQHMQPYPQYQQQYYNPQQQYYNPQQQYYNPHPPPAGPYPPQPGVQAAPPYMQPDGRAGQATVLAPNDSVSRAAGAQSQSAPGLASSRGSSRSSSQTGEPSSSGMAGGHIINQPTSAGGHVSLQSTQMGRQMGVQPSQAGGQLHVKTVLRKSALEAVLAAKAARGPQKSLMSPGAGSAADSSSSSSTATFECLRTAPNAGRALLAKLQNQGDPGNSSSSTVPSAAVHSNSPGVGNTAAANSSGSSSQAPTASSQKGPVTSIDPKGVYLKGLPADTTMQQLQALFADVGSIRTVDMFGDKRPGFRKCAFTNFNEEAAAQQVLARKFVQVGEGTAQVFPKTKMAKGKVQQAAQSQQAGALSSAAAAAGSGAKQNAKQNPKLLGRNEEGLPQLRGAACCPFYMGTGRCEFRDACKYHHPNYALHPVCIATGRNPHRYTGDMPSYARLVNFTERLWDYGSCVEAQLKIWLARHLIASENSGCGMFDESAAVPAAPEYHLYPDDSQPLGPYSCPLEEAEQVLQLLWKAQPDEAAKQAMPYQGRVNVLLNDDPYYAIGLEAQAKRTWVHLKVENIKDLLNF